MVTTGDRMSRESILYAVDHLFLPPKLPQEHDYSPTPVKGMIDFVLQACQEFDDCSPASHKSITKAIHEILLTFKYMHIIGETQVSLDSSRFADNLRQLCVKGTMRSSQSSSHISLTDFHLDFCRRLSSCPDYLSEFWHAGHSL